MAKQKAKSITIDTEAKYELAKILTDTHEAYNREDDKLKDFIKELMGIENIFIAACGNTSDAAADNAKKEAKLKVDMDLTSGGFRLDDFELLFLSLTSLLSNGVRITDEVIEKTFSEIFPKVAEASKPSVNFNQMARSEGVASTYQQVKAKEDQDTKQKAFENAALDPIESDKPRFLTANQELHEKAILENKLTLTDGLVGTGKTFIACRVALDLLRAGEIETIYLTRAPKGVGDSLGYLPGDKSAKMAEWLVPLYTELSSNLKGGDKALDTLIAKEKISIQTLEHIRGRTLKNCVFIVDEAQNLTEENLDALIGRLGENAKGVFVGDTHGQIDIENSGYKFIVETIENSPKAKEQGMAVTRYFAEDIIRSELVRSYNEILTEARVKRIADVKEASEVANNNEDEITTLTKEFYKVMKKIGEYMEEHPSEPKIAANSNGKLSLSAS